MQCLMPAEKIVFDNNSIRFDNFPMLDSRGNKAIVTGDVGIEHLPELAFNLKINANNWQAVHSTIKENKEDYGDPFVTASLSAKGTSSSPYVDGNLSILPGTNLPVVNPEATPHVHTSKGIVEFVNMKD